jgi:hypothetical protein
MTSGIGLRRGYTRGEKGLCMIKFDGWLDRLAAVVSRSMRRNGEQTSKINVKHFYDVYGHSSVGM